MTRTQTSIDGTWQRPPPLLFRHLGPTALLPVLAIGLYGIAWIALHASAGRGATHTALQVIALSESIVALLARSKKPLWALYGILVMYILVDLQAITVVPLLFALFTVAQVAKPTRTAVAAVVTTSLVIAIPYALGNPVTMSNDALRLVLPPVAVLAGLWSTRKRPPIGP